MEHHCGEIVFPGLGSACLLYRKREPPVGAAVQRQYPGREALCRLTRAGARTPTFQNITRIENGGFDQYNALQLALTHQWKDGLYLQVFYTEQRSSNDMGNGTNTSRDTAPGATIDYAYDRKRDASRSSFWPYHDFLINAVYDLPFGSGRQFGTEWKDNGFMGKLLNGVAGGWSFSGIFNWHSGNFGTPIYNGVDPGGIGQFSGRPDLKPGCNPNTGFSPKNSTGAWWDASCFTIPAARERSGMPLTIFLNGPACGS